MGNKTAGKNNIPKIIFNILELNFIFSKYLSMIKTNAIKRVIYIIKK